jgi:hypothetical protein
MSVDLSKIRFQGARIIRVIEDTDHPRSVKYRRARQKAISYQ